MTCLGGAGMGDEEQVCPACGRLVWTLHYRLPDGRVVCQSCARDNRTRLAKNEAAIS